MKKVKYFILAKAIKFFLVVGFLFTIIAFAVNLFIASFNTRSYVEIRGGTLGDSFSGYRLNAMMHMDIPDTINYYQDGNERISSSWPKRLRDSQKISQHGKVQEQIVNRIISDEDQTIKISNDLRVNGKVALEVLSKNRIQNIFWGTIEQLNIAFLIFLFLILIKLVNRYLDGDIFMSRTFNLVSFLGILLIASSVLQFVVGIINMLILQHPQLHTFSTLSKKGFNVVNLSFDFTGSVNYSNIGIGIFIILLAQVLKEAIMVKQENELTI